MPATIAASSKGFFVVATNSTNQKNIYTHSHRYIYIHTHSSKYETLAGATGHCPGHYIKVIKCIMRGKVAR
jgi:hypothetical protein